MILAVLLASAVVSWTVSAMAGDDGGGATAAPSAAAPGETEQEADPTDPENAEPFDGLKHKTYDASIDVPPSTDS